MKEILPVQMWNNGQLVNANFLQLLCINDNLENQAQFFYSLFSMQELGLPTNNIQLVSGNLTLAGADYDLWEQNQYAWDWAAAQLNLTFAPIVESTTTTTVAPEVNVPGTIN